MALHHLEVTISCDTRPLRAGLKSAQLGCLKAQYGILRFFTVAYWRAFFS